ncbi:MAG: DNA-directed RNA polymerase subunit alpha C-terminal domain-containing protein [Ruthenibacterium sp.]
MHTIESLARLSYPNNLIYDIYQKAGEDFSTFVPPVDIAESIEAVLDTLSDKAATAIVRRYDELCSLSEIGKELGVTRERIRVMLEQSLYKLQRQNTLRLIQCGLLQFNEEQKILQLAREQSEADERKRIENERQSRIEEMRQKMGFNKAIPTAGDKAPIETLNLTYRAFRILRQAHVFTVKDIYTLGVEGMMSLKGFGWTTCHNVCLALVKQGYQEPPNLLSHTLAFELMSQPDTAQSTELLKQQIAEYFNTIKGGEQLKQMPLRDINFSCRSFHCLNDANLKTLSDIYLLGSAKIKKFPNLGHKSYHDICNVLNELGCPPPDYFHLLYGEQKAS